MPTDTLVISFPTSFFQLKFLSKIRFFSSRITANVLGLCVRAGFGAQSFNSLLKFIRGTKLQVCTSARLTQNPCYGLVWFSVSRFVSVFFLSVCLYNFIITFLSAMHSLWSGCHCPLNSFVQPY